MITHRGHTAHLTFFIVGSMLFALACTDSHGVDDGGDGTDGGTVIRTDAGMAGTDAGMSDVDGGMSSTDAGGPTDDAGGASDGGAPAIDGSTPANDGGLGVVCDTDVCTGTEVCCVMSGGARMCTEPADCMGAEVTCDGPEDCASGENCCGSFTGG